MSKRIFSFRIIKDLKKLDKEIIKTLKDCDGYLSHLSLNVLRSGGKRLRPALVLICGQIREYDFNKLKKVAMAIELIHMASLIHDDFLDRSELRRGKPTIYSKYGWQKAIAVGDYLFSLAFYLLGINGNNRVIEILSRSAVDLSLGELEQMEGITTKKQDSKHYLERIWKKTASLFSSSCLAGAIIGEGKEEDIANLGKFGKNLGIAFQIYDDILDIVGDEKVTGKPSGIDIADCIFTLPVIYALESSSHSHELFKITTAKEKNRDEVERALEIIKSTDAVILAKKEAKNYINKALESLSSIEEDEVKNNLSNIGQYVIERFN